MNYNNSYNHQTMFEKHFQLAWFLQILKYMKVKRLQCTDHILRLPLFQISKQALRANLNDTHSVGRPRKRWKIIFRRMLSVYYSWPHKIRFSLGRNFRLKHELQHHCIDGWMDGFQNQFIILTIFHCHPIQQLCFFPVSLSSLIQHFQQVLWVLKFLLFPDLGS